MQYMCMALLDEAALGGPNQEDSAAALALASAAAQQACLSSLCVACTQEESCLQCCVVDWHPATLSPNSYIFSTWGFEHCALMI